MFTIKLKDGFRTRILEAESFTILHCHTDKTDKVQRHWAEVTIHHPSGDKRYDLGDSPMRDVIDSEVTAFGQCYIENAAGKTVEAINYDLPRKAA